MYLCTLKLCIKMNSYRKSETINNKFIKFNSNAKQRID